MQTERHETTMPDLDKPDGIEAVRKFAMREAEFAQGYLRLLIAQ